jgi:hypothetical protein
MLRHQEPTETAPDRGDHEPDREIDDAAEAPEDREHQVAHRPEPEPNREEDEEELAEADLLEKPDADHLMEFEGPDA